MESVVTTFGQPVFTDINLDGVSDGGAVWDIGAFTTVSVQLVVLITPGGSFTVTFQRSNDGVNPVALEAAQTLTAAGMTPAINASGFRYLHAKVTSANTGKVRLFPTGKAV